MLGGKGLQAVSELGLNSSSTFTMPLPRGGSTCHLIRSAVSSYSSSSTSVKILSVRAGFEVDVSAGFSKRPAIGSNGDADAPFLFDGLVVSLDKCEGVFSLFTPRGLQRSLGSLNSSRMPSSPALTAAPSKRRLAFSGELLPRARPARLTVLFTLLGVGVEVNFLNSLVACISPAGRCSLTRSTIFPLVPLAEQYTLSVASKASLKIMVARIRALLPVQASPAE